MLAFPIEKGRAWDFENNAMIDAVADLIDTGRDGTGRDGTGRVKLYYVDSADSWTWSDRSAPIEERARRHDEYESWICRTVAPWISADCAGTTEIVTVGCSLGAYHAINIALRHVHVFPLAIGLSGNYDPTTWHARGDQGDATYFHNPMAYVANMEGGHLDWLRRQLSILLVIGQGAFEESPTAALQSTRAFADLRTRSRTISSMPRPAPRQSRSPGW